MSLMLRRYIFVVVAVLGGTCGSYGQWQGQSNGANLWVGEDGKSSTVTLIYRADGKFMARENTSQLDYIKTFVDNNRKSIANKELKIWVDSYVNRGDMPGYLCRREALSLSNIFKSYAISNWGLSESDFTTQNFSGTYDGKGWVTVVSMGERYPFEHIDALQSLNLSDFLSSEPIIERQTLAGKEVDGESPIGQEPISVDDTAALTKILALIERNESYEPKGKRPDMLKVGSSSQAVKSSSLAGVSKATQFTQNQVLMPMGMIPHSPYELSVVGGSTLSAGNMYGLNVPSLMSVREPVSQAKKDFKMPTKVDNGKSMPSIQVDADGNIILEATTLGYNINKGALAQEQRDLRASDAAQRRADRELTYQQKSSQLFAQQEAKGRFPIMGIGINALAALTTTVSGQLDFYFHNHMSLGVEGAYNNWNVLGDRYRNTVWMGSAEFRYWFGKKKQFTGFYLGAYGSMGDFNFRFGSNEGTQSSFYSIGLTAGYVLRMGRQSNFYVDFGLGGGYIHESGVDYTYYEGDNIFKQSFIKVGIVPTKAKITFTYRIFNQPKGGLY